MTEGMSVLLMRILYRQISQHWEHCRGATSVRSYSEAVASDGDLLGHRTWISINFWRQPTSGSSHRSRHEGLGARVGVWGDAAGTAPAVTSASRLSLRFKNKFQVITQIPFNCAPIRRASYFWLLARLSSRSDPPHFAVQVGSDIHKFVRYPKKEIVCHSMVIKEDSRMFVL
jgi:hypothetical protein